MSLVNTGYSILKGVFSPHTPSAPLFYPLADSSTG